MGVCLWRVSGLAIGRLCWGVARSTVWGRLLRISGSLLGVLWGCGGGVVSFIGRHDCLCEKGDELMEREKMNEKRRELKRADEEEGTFMKVGLSGLAIDLYM